MAIRGQSNERFGNLPLPIELDSRATEGELMVGRTTGHIYIRNGGKNVSKTVEIEEFLKALRMGALNWVRQSGNFDTNLLGDWFIHTNGGVNSTEKFRVVTENDRTFLRISGYTSQDTQKQYYLGCNRLHSYHKAKFIVGKKIALSFMAKTNKSATVNVRICNVDSSNAIMAPKDISVTTSWQKFEIVGEVTNVGNLPVIAFEFNTPDMLIDIDELQLEPGDRSFAWRPSFYDMIQQMEFKDTQLKINLENKITEAIKECKKYTDTEITKLGDKFKIMVEEAITECKNYTNEEIKKVNNRITTEVTELEQKDRMGRAHLILGNNDWSKYARAMNGSNPTIKYDANELGVVITSTNTENWVELLKEIPVFKDTKYYVRVKVKQIEGTGRFYCGAKSLDGNLNDIQGDKATLYNYGVAFNTVLTNGEEREFSGFFEGYNTPDGNLYDKFDPGAQFFRLVFLTNYGGTGKVAIKGVEIFEVPKCLHNALSVASPSKDGLMSIDEHRKLATVEWNANNYSHPTGDGNLHVPATGTANDRKVLTAGKTAGSAKWETLPDDIDKVDGKHANEFVWVHEEPKTLQTTQVISKVNQVYKTVLAPGANVTGYIRIECSKVPFANYFGELQLSLYSSSFGNTMLQIGFNMVSATNITSTYAFSSNRALTKETMFIKCENETPVLYIGSNTFRNLIVNIDQYITFWSGDFEDYKNWNISIVDALPSNVFTIKFNSELNANYLNNRASDTYADKQGAKVDSYATPTPDKKVANMNTRGNNENSWLVLDPTVGAESNYGIYHNGSGQAISVPGEVDLPPDAFGVIANNKLQHYHDMRTGDAYHKGNLESHNIQLGNFRIIKNDSKKSLDFILD